MAQPIRATPTLTGKEALKFLNMMEENEKVAPSRVDKRMLKIIRENSKTFQM